MVWVSCSCFHLWLFSPSANDTGTPSSTDFTSISTGASLEPQRHHAHSLSAKNRQPLATSIATMSLPFRRHDVVPFQSWLKKLLMPFQRSLPARNHPLTSLSATYYRLLDHTASTTMFPSTPLQASRQPKSKRWVTFQHTTFSAGYHSRTHMRTSILRKPCHDHIGLLDGHIIKLCVSRETFPRSSLTDVYIQR